MDDIAPELYERLKAEYERRRGSAADAAEKAKGYRDVLSWADHAGRSAALTFDGILPEELPDGMMYFNIAERTLRPVLEEVAADVLTVAKAAQETLNAAAGIEMAFQAPDEEDKIKGLVDLACAGPWEARQDDFCAATQTYASKVSDDCIRQNAGSQYDAGMDPKIIRTAGPGACIWCASLAGTYDYEKVRRGSEVFSRHVNCNCVVEYEPRKGRRQNVHTKSWNEEKIESALSSDERRMEALARRAFNTRDKVFEYFAKTKPIDGYEDFAIHGDERGVYYYETSGKKNRLSAEEYGAIIQADPGYHGGSIRLLSCGTGALDDGFAQELADFLNVEVLAPSEILYIKEDGELFITNSRILAEMWYDGEKVNQSGEWKSFKPRK